MSEHDRFREALTWLRWRLRPLAILGLLISIGAWGHHTHWSLTPHAHASHAAKPRARRSDLALSGAKQAPRTSYDAPEVVGPDRVRFESDEAVRRAGIRCVEVAASPIEEYAVANGVVGYDHTRLAQLAAKVPGAVWRVEKKLGQSVRKGDVLALIESADVGRAKADFLSAVAHLRHVETRLKMVQPLESVVAARQIREAEANVREARIQLYNAHQALVNLGLAIDPEQAQLAEDVALVQQMQFLGLPAELAAKFDPATTTANLIPLFAPFDGVVIGRDVVLGEVALPTEPQFAIADCSHLWITLHVRIEDSDELAIGQQVKFSPDGAEQSVDCSLRWISPEMDEKTRTVEVRADVVNPRRVDPTGAETGQWLLHVNCFGTGKIRTLAKESVVCLPNIALQFAGSQPVVFVDRGDCLFQQAPVTLGIQLADRTEIVSGIEPGDRVVTTGSLLLKAELEQQDVQVAAAPAP